MSTQTLEHFESTSQDHPCDHCGQKWEDHGEDAACQTNEQFTCHDCKETKSIQTDGGTGYATCTDNEDRTRPEYKVCYACCAERDRQYMRDTEYIILYVHEPEKNGRPTKVTNWPGALEFQITRYARSFHNFAGYNGRLDVWFQFEGYEWHGTHIGQRNQICRCRKTKRKRLWIKR